MTTSKHFMNNANEVYKRYLSGIYLSKSDLAKSLGISRNDINPLIKIYEWPIEIKNKIQNMNLSKRKILDLTLLKIEEVERFVDIEYGKKNQNVDPIPIPTRLMKGVNANECSQVQMQSYAGTGTERMQVNANECSQVQSPSLVSDAVLKRIKICFVLSAAAILVSLLVGLAAWLTCDLYVDTRAYIRPFLAYAVLLVIGVVLPFVAHIANGWGKPIAWMLVALGILYSGLLVTVGNWQRGRLEDTQAESNRNRITFLTSELTILEEQHSQWIDGYTQPNHKNYHKAFAAKKASELLNRMNSIQKEIAKLNANVVRFSWLMVIVDILRQLVIELAVVVLVHTLIKKCSFIFNTQENKDCIR